MKHITLSLLLFLLGITLSFAQYAEPAVTGASFVSNKIDVGQTSTLTISFANSGSSSIPIGSIELTISTAPLYYSSDGVSAPTGAGAALFNWAYLGADVWRGTNNIEINAFGGGDIILPVNGIAISPSYETTNINVQPVNSFASFLDVTNNNNLQPTLKVEVPTIVDTDGDGDPDSTDPNSSNECVYSAGQVFANASQAWLNSDCDGDGVTNGKELDPDGDGTVGPNGTNPLSACSLTLANVTLTATSTGDCDGDGVSDADEINSTGIGDPQTDPNALCAYNKAEQILGNVSVAWNSADCDNDGTLNGTDPNPQESTSVNDSLTAPYGITSSINVLDNDDFVPQSVVTVTNTGGTAGGAVGLGNNGILSYTPLLSEQGATVTVTYTVCNTSVLPNICENATVIISVPTPAPAPNLRITKAGPTTLSSPGNYIYTLKVYNDGNAISNGTITVRDVLPSGIAFISGIGTGWTCGGNGQTVTCTSTSSIPASTEGQSITLNVTAMNSGVYLNTASVYGGGDTEAVSTNTAKSSNTVTTSVAEPCGKLSPRVYLQGAESNNVSFPLMRDDLRVKNLIPLQQPYANAEYSEIGYNGTEQTTNAVLSITGNNAVVDWVVVELRDKVDPSVIVSSQAGLLLRNGDIVKPDGVSQLEFCIALDNYFVAVRHRNHMGVMTSNSIPLLSSGSIIDFTLPSTPTFSRADGQGNAFPQKTMQNAMVMWAGNAKMDTFVKAQATGADKDEITASIWQDAGNSSNSNSYFFTRYARTDLDMNGITKMQGTANDIDFLYSIIWFHNTNISTSNTLFFYQQLP